MKHPLEQFRFCPKCGSPRFFINNEKSKKCESCGFVYYFNPSGAVVAIIENERGELLVGRRAKEPAKGSLDLPGGFVDMYESAEEAVVREVWEETRLRILPPKYLFSIPNIYVYSGFEVQTVDMFFRCTASDFEGSKAQDDVAELLFMTRARLNPNDFGLNSIRKGIEQILSEGIG